MFRKRRAELGEPNKLLFVVKLASPTLSWGILKRIIKIKNKHVTNVGMYNINLMYL